MNGDEAVRKDRARRDSAASFFLSREDIDHNRTPPIQFRRRVIPDSSLDYCKYSKGPVEGHVGPGIVSHAVRARFETFAPDENRARR